MVINNHASLGSKPCGHLSVMMGIEKEKTKQKMLHSIVIGYEKHEYEYFLHLFFPKFYSSSGNRWSLDP